MCVAQMQKSSDKIYEGLRISKAHIQSLLALMAYLSHCANPSVS